MNAEIQPAEPGKQTTVADLRKQVAPRASSLPNVRAGFNDSHGFELLQRAANALAASSLVPTQFQGNMPNCLIALEMAQRIGASPLMVAQNLYLVHGRPAWSAKFLIATFNQCGRFSALRYEWQGTPGSDEWGCRAWAIERENQQKIQGALITIGLAKKEGWYQKAGSKWQTIPEQMLMYRSAAWLVNTHAPEISMGLNTADELGDVFDAVPGPDGAFTVEGMRANGGAAPEAPTPAPKPAVLPVYDETTAIKAIKGTKTLKQFEQLATEIVDDFGNTNRELPIAVDAAINDRREALRE